VPNDFKEIIELLKVNKEQL